MNTLGLRATTIVDGTASAEISTTLSANVDDQVTEASVTSTQSANVNTVLSASIAPNNLTAEICK